MELRDFGHTGLRVSPLGFGAMHINDERTSEAEAGRLLNEVLDLGVNLIDTARGYGLSEERIGRHIAHRRSDYVLSTKVGYLVEGVPDWTYDCIVAGVERALRLMQTDWLDIVHLHSCPLHILQADEVIRALDDCRRAGKLRVAAYAGDNEELAFALADGRFGSLQTSISLCDQANLAERLPLAREHGLGVIAKRPIAGAVWRFASKPEAHAEGHYWERWRAMGVDPRGLDWAELALRFAAHQQGVSSALVGTASPANLRRNLDAIARGPLPAELEAALCAAFERESGAQGGWAGLI